MSDSEELMIVPEEEVPEIIDEAFEIEKPDALIPVAEAPDRSYTVFEMQEIIARTTAAAVAAHDQSLEEKKAKKHNRKQGKRHTDTRIDLTKWVFALTALWTIVVGFCVVAAGFGLITMSDTILGLLIGTIAISQIGTIIAKWWFRENSETSNSN